MSKAKNTSLRDDFELEIIYKDVGDLTAYANNSKIHSDEQRKIIRASLLQFGFVNAVLLDGDNGIIAGHCRWEEAEKLGYKKIPTVELSHFTPEEKRAYVIVDNRSAELHTSWDMELVNIELEGLDFDLFDIGDLDFEVIQEDDGINPLEQSSPDEFKDIEEFDLEHKCPKCGYEFD